MCLFSFSPCRAGQPTDLARDLKTPTPDIVAAGVVRCTWYKAVAHHDHHPSVFSTDEHVPQRGVKFPDGNDICPYLVIRHDEYIFDEDLQRITEAVLMGSLEKSDRGCRKCWSVVTREGWVGELPGEAEKMKYLYTTSEVEDFGGHSIGGSAGAEGRTSGLKRGRAHEEDTFYGFTTSQYASSIAERALKRSRNELPRRLGWTQSPSPSTLSESQHSMSPEPPIVKSEAEDSVIADSEIIPPRPDKINKSDSEDYDIQPSSVLLNWNQAHDKLFANMTQKGRSHGKPRNASPVKEEELEDPLEASRRQIAVELGANSESWSFSTGKGDSLAAESVLLLARDQLAQLPKARATLDVETTETAKSTKGEAELEAPNGVTDATIPLEDRMTELRREVTQLRNRVVSLLNEQAAANQREAELLRKLSKHEGRRE